MKTQYVSFMIALLMFGISGGAQIGSDPFYSYIDQETDRLELEEELFGFQNDFTEPISILSIDLFEVEEEFELGFDSSDYLPKDFDPNAGKNRLDWNKIPLFEVEEEIDLNIKTGSTGAIGSSM